MTAEAPPSQAVALNRYTLLRLANAIRFFASSDVGGRAAALAGLLLGLLLGINGLNVLNSYVGRDFMTAIERRDGQRFLVQALLYLAVFAASTVAAVFTRFAEERLGLLWRDWITRQLSTFYLEGRLYYWLHAAGRLTNPDQRIAEDVRAFTTTTLSLALIFLNSALTMIAFSGVLWSISRTLFAVAVGYAALGSMLAVVLGRPLVRLNYDQSDREASFRAELVHVGDNVEQIALLHQERHLTARLLRRIDALVANLKRIIAVNRNLGFFTTGYNYLIQLIPVFIVAPLFIDGSADFGVIPQSSMAFAQLLGAFSVVVNQFPQLSSYAAVLARLSPLADAVGIDPQMTGGVTVAKDEHRFAFERLTLRTPHDGRVLLRELSLEVPARARIVVTGSSDLVLGALERAVAGIWESGEGRIVRPSLEDVMLLPARPYLPPGTLRELFAARASSEHAMEGPIWDALRTVAVEAAVERVGGLDVERDWDAVLSLEEQRRIGVARLLLAAPRFVVLAHLDAALGAERAERVLATLGARAVGYIVLGDCASSAAFETLVAIAADGAWTVTRPKEAA
jgi:putative ATP-binding cassette transporter